jgi:hypothetical protein
MVELPCVSVNVYEVFVVVSVEGNDSIPKA